uniref:Uncharacterized protein n=1 Tax=Rhizophora mucronata TaxID=61149 RepID=A0A2P2PG47_RHIMU
MQCVFQESCILVLSKSAMAFVSLFQFFLLFFLSL